MDIQIATSRQKPSHAIPAAGTFGSLVPTSKFETFAKWLDGSYQDKRSGVVSLWLSYGMICNDSCGLFSFKFINFAFRQKALGEVSHRFPLHYHNFLF